MILSRTDCCLLAYLVSCIGCVLVLSPASAWASVINNCQVDLWSNTYEPAPGKRALHWCVSEDPAKWDQVASLMMHMALFCPPTEAVCSATGFGSNLALLRIGGEAFLNPVVVEHSDETKWYRCRGGKPPLHTWIRIEYINARKERATTTLDNLRAQAFECTLLSHVDTLADRV